MFQTCAACGYFRLCRVIDVWKLRRAVCRECERLPARTLEEKCVPVLRRLREVSRPAATSVRQKPTVPLRRARPVAGSPKPVG
jgi:hypothetical protein